MKPTVSIVIVNWNAGTQLFEAVNSIIEYAQGVVHSVVIVDNASTDDSLAQVMVLDNLPFHLEIIRNSENRGFGVACNQGAALSSSKYLLFLNPDTRLFAHSLTVPLAFMENGENRNVGIVGIQLVDKGSKIARNCARFPSVLSFAAHTVGLTLIVPNLGHIMSEWDHAQTRQVDHVIGAFYFMRRSLFDALHGFDENFFVYLEDLDLSYRANQLGWQCMYLSNAQAFHSGGGTSLQVKARRLFYSLRSRLQYGFKHFPFWRAWLLFAITVLIEPVSRSAFSMLRGGVNDVGNTWRGFAMLYRDLPKIIRDARRKNVNGAGLDKC